MADVTKLEYGIFSLSLYLNGHREKWDGLLQVHDTHGLPFDIIFLKLAESSDELPKHWDSDNFKEFMGLYRQERADPYVPSFANSKFDEKLPPLIKQ